MTIRILQVVTSMNAGGIETMLMNIYRQLDRNKIQFDFLVHREFKGFYEDEITALGGKIFRIMAIRPNNFRKYKHLLLNFYKEHPEYKIIHSHISVLSYFVLSVAKKNNIPIRIAHSHETHQNIWSHQYWRIPFILYLKHIINEQLTHRFACGEAAGQWLFGKHEKFTVINNGIDTRKFIYNSDKANAVKNSLGIKEKFVVGHVGRFQTQKNHTFLIDIFKTINEKNKNAVLLLVGDGELRQSIELKVKELGLSESIIFTGVRSDIPDLLQAMDVFLFPSLFEGLPVTIIEAQTSGLKCIIADTISSEVKKTNLVEFISLEKSTEIWADDVLTYANGYNRKDAINEIIEAGYDIKDSPKWLENFYLNVVNPLPKDKME